MSTDFEARVSAVKSSGSMNLDVYRATGEVLEAILKKLEEIRVLLAKSPI